MLDSSLWRLAQAAASLPYKLDGDTIPTARTLSRRTWINSAEGMVARISPSRVWITGEHVAALRHALPDNVDFGALVGKRVRLTLVHSASPASGITQSLTITGRDDERPYLIAHAGHVGGIGHVLGKVPVYIALSQRQGGPLVFGTSRVQTLVRVGDTARVRDGDDSYVLHFQSRNDHGEASYAILGGGLWRD